ncbi:mandelate racemase/muconate lactonizing enzyme family protein [Fulvivirga ligni]|uniref:mandelate racemase/muconate lactonizing enzyme family protein n=1 Tax=Fulvivirga ligni TaxID=2904246 RepID=UPI001F31268A|nr:dipeptide epimerase [Fulvivirga ligni]UII23592.1 dipeptide epimerase [Fulvivirga ligni]
MKIKSIDVWRMNLGNTRPYTIAFKTVSDVDSVFVKLTLENGIYGMGAGNPSQQVVGESLDDTLNTLSEENLRFLIGRDIREFNGILHEVMTRFPKTPAARAALDIALHDGFCKYLGVPVAAFLGQKINKMETSVTIGIKNVADTLEEAQEYYDMGFRCLKVKTGHDVDEDIERMVKLREVFSSQMKIRVDANQGYEKEDLFKFFNDTKALDIELIEQPLKSSNIMEMKALPDEVKGLIAADESLKSPENAFELASPPVASKIFNIKLMKSGGIYPAIQIANIARVSGVELMWGCNDESAVSISAALHAALCFSNTKYIDLDGSLDLVQDAVSGGFKIENGWMSVTDKPGLGVELI